MDVGTVLVIFSTISFVGIGVPFPSAHLAEWGGMIEYYRDYLTLYPWTVAAPGLAVFISLVPGRGKYYDGKFLKPRVRLQIPEHLEAIFSWHI